VTSRTLQRQLKQGTSHHLATNKIFSCKMEDKIFCENGVSHSDIIKIASSGM
jgi:hypothetical protein